MMYSLRRLARAAANAAWVWSEFLCVELRVVRDLSPPCFPFLLPLLVDQTTRWGAAPVDCRVTAVFQGRVV